MSLVGSLRGVQANPEPCNSNSNSNSKTGTLVQGLNYSVQINKHSHIIATFQ